MEIKSEKQLETKLLVHPCLLNPASSMPGARRQIQSASLFLGQNQAHLTLNSNVFLDLTKLNLSEWKCKKTTREKTKMIKISLSFIITIQKMLYKPIFTVNINQLPNSLLHCRVVVGGLDRSLAQLSQGERQLKFN